MIQDHLCMNTVLGNFHFHPTLPYQTRIMCMICRYLFCLVLFLTYAERFSTFLCIRAHRVFCMHPCVYVHVHCLHVRKWVCTSHWMASILLIQRDLIRASWNTWDKSTDLSGLTLPPNMQTHTQTHDTHSNSSTVHCTKKECCSIAKQCVTWSENYCTSIHQDTSLKLSNIKGSLITAHSWDTNSLIYHICLRNERQSEAGRDRERKKLKRALWVKVSN